MENASKALLMAGGILLSIIIIAVLVRSFTSISIFQKAKLTEEEQEQLVAFNEQYTKYLNQYVYGTEVITIINKTLNSKEYKVETVIEFASKYEYKTYEWKKGKKIEKEIYIKAGEDLKITNSENNTVTDVINNPSKDNDSLMRRAFKCTNIEFDNTGRVNSIKFEEKQWGDLD